jgi:hypothetical protein
LVVIRIATVFERGKLRLLSESLRKQFCPCEDTCKTLQLEQTVSEYPDGVVVTTGHGRSPLTIVYGGRKTEKAGLTREGG